MDIYYCQFLLDFLPSPLMCVCVKILIWYMYLKTKNCCLKTCVKYVWVKKCVDIRVMLFKNWKLLSENMYQTPLYSKKNKRWLCLLFLFLLLLIFLLRVGWNLTSPKMSSFVFKLNDGIHSDCWVLLLLISQFGVFGSLVLYSYQYVT